MHKNDRKFNRSYFGIRKGYESSAARVLAWLIQKTGAVYNSKSNPSPFLLIDPKRFPKLPHSFKLEQAKGEYPLYSPVVGDIGYHFMSDGFSKFYIVFFEDSSALLMSGDKSEILPIVCQMKGGDDYRVMKHSHRDELEKILHKDAKSLWDAHQKTKPLARTHEDKGLVEPPQGYEWSVYDTFSQNSLRINASTQSAYHLVKKVPEPTSISQETLASLAGFAIDCVSIDDVKEPFEIALYAPLFRQEAGFSLQIFKKSGRKYISLPKRISNLIFSLHPEITLLAGNSIWSTIPSNTGFGMDLGNQGLILNIIFNAGLSSHDIMRYKMSWRKNLDPKQVMSWNDVLDKIKN